MPTAGAHDSKPVRPACPVCRRLDTHDNVFCFECFRAGQAGASHDAQAEAATLPFMRPLGEDSPAPGETAVVRRQPAPVALSVRFPGPAGALTAAAIRHRWRMLSHLSAARSTASGWRR